MQRRWLRHARRSARHRSHHPSRHPSSHCRCATNCGRRCDLGAKSPARKRCRDPAHQTPLCCVFATKQLRTPSEITKNKRGSAAGLIVRPAGRRINGYHGNPAFKAQGQAFQCACRHRRIPMNGQHPVAARNDPSVPPLLSTQTLQQHAGAHCFGCLLLRTYCLRLTCRHARVHAHGLREFTTSKYMMHPIALLDNEEGNRQRSIERLTKMHERTPQQCTLKIDDPMWKTHGQKP